MRPRHSHRGGIDCDTDVPIVVRAQRVYACAARSERRIARLDHREPAVHSPFSPQDDTVELLRTNPIEAEVIVARLRSEGIAAAVFGSEGYDAYGPLFANADGARVMVRRADLQVAGALAKETD